MEAGVNPLGTVVSAQGKTGKAQNEHKISGSPPIPDMQESAVVRRFVPTPEIMQRSKTV